MNKKIALLGIVLLAAVGLYVALRSRSTPTKTSSTQNQSNTSPAVVALTKQIQEAAKTDSDLDGLTNAEEARLGTDPNVADTDGDGITDGVEVKMFKSNPLKKDSFNLGMTDSEAVIKGLIKPDKGLQLK